MSEHDRLREALTGAIERNTECTELSPCPFCGYGGEWVEIRRFEFADDKDDPYWAICCNSCGTDGPVGSRENCITYWNNRATDD